MTPCTVDWKLSLVLNTKTLPVFDADTNSTRPSWKFAPSQDSYVRPSPHMVVLRSGTFGGIRKRGRVPTIEISALTKQGAIRSSCYKRTQLKTSSVKHGESAQRPWMYCHIELGFLSPSAMRNTFLLRISQPVCVLCYCSLNGSLVPFNAPGSDRHITHCLGDLNNRPRSAGAVG